MDFSKNKYYTTPNYSIFLRLTKGKIQAKTNNGKTNN